MSIHSSLRSRSGSRRHRSVLKRYERLKVLQEKGLWDEKKSVLGIPKVKMQRIRVKKEKAASPEAAAAAPKTAAPVAAAPAKSPAPAKGEKK